MLVILVKKIRKAAQFFWDKWKTPSEVRVFSKHSKKLFQPGGGSDCGEKVILLEANDMFAEHISYSYMANALKQDLNGEIVAYVPYPLGRWRKLLYKFLEACNRGMYLSYRSFGVSSFLYMSPDRDSIRMAQKFLRNILSTLRTKHDLEMLTVDGILVGDLIYDSFLRHYKLETVNMAESRFMSYLVTQLALFFLWRDYFERNDISAVVVSHDVYELAFPARIGYRCGASVFLCGNRYICRMDEPNFRRLSETKRYRDDFKDLPQRVREGGKKEAKRRLMRRLSGEVGVDMSYVPISSFGQASKERVVLGLKHVRILVLTHQFSDSPHVYGNNLFPDFYEWMIFLGEISKKTDYEWYVKNHPYSDKWTIAAVNNIIKSYPRLKLVPAGVSHNQLVQEGVNVALTVYGTAGCEYPLLGVPVINCSVNNPHVAYDFNLHPKSVDEYEEQLINLGAMIEHGLCVDKEQIYEYYFMNKILNTQNIFFCDINRSEMMVKRLSGDAFTSTSAKWLIQWIAEWNDDRHREILAAMSRFIDSGDQRFSYRSLPRLFGLQDVSMNE